MMPMRQWLCCLYLLGLTVTAGAFQLRDSASPWRNPISTRTALFAKEKASVSFRTAPQQRRKPQTRRPNFYWQNIDNVKTEIQDFWRNLGVNNTVSNKKSKEYICIPNETLLNYFGRHDLRAAIATHGGREELAYTNRKFVIMPGKWSEAVDTSPELQFLLQNKTLGFSKETPPMSKHAKQKQVNSGSQNSTTTAPAKGQKWLHQPDRKPKGFWNQQRVVVEMYKYLDEYQEKFGRPAAWMPRPSELSANGREDLKLALGRFGGTKRITQLAGLVPFREWHFFEGQYELLLLLKAYIDEFGLHTATTTDNNSHRYQAFPCVSYMQSNGHERLYSLVQYYGGTTFLSSRLGMTTTTRQGESWGAFCIDFAIRLCEFIRNDHMRVKPPLRNPIIAIPSEARLRQAGPEGAWLHEKIMEFGGYENVARRLYLGYTFSRPMR